MDALLASFTGGSNDLDPLVAARLHELGLEKYGKKLAGESLANVEDYAELGPDELDEVGREVGMTVGHRLKFKRSFLMGLVPQRATADQAKLEHDQWTIDEVTRVRSWDELCPQQDPNSQSPSAARAAC